MGTIEFIPVKTLEFKAINSAQGWIVAFVALLAIGGLVWYFGSQQSKQTTTNNATTK